MISAVVYLLIALLSYAGSRKAGLSKGKAALVAAGVTAGAYHFKVGDKVASWFQHGTPNSGPDDLQPAIDDYEPKERGSVLSSLGEAISDNASTLVKAGTVAGAAGLGAGAGYGATKHGKSWLPWLIGGGAALILLTRD